jgi:ABC-type transport system involved in multi-copper enzyme maturation permease subunit
MSILSDTFRSLSRLFTDDLGVFGTLGFLGFLMLLGLIGYCLVNPRTRTIARHTWRAAFRFRFFWVMAILLIAAVVGLPMAIKGDGTAEGLTQILITYTLSFAFFFLAAGTLWLSAGTLAQDIEDAQMQMIATKPIARWQIWMGKWIGIMALNIVLLAMVGVAILGVVEYRAQSLTGEELERIKDQQPAEIFVSALKGGIDVFERDENDGFVKAPKNQPLLRQFASVFEGRPVENEMAMFFFQQKAEPLLKSTTQLRLDVAGLEEKKLREQVLTARAALPLMEVRAARAAGEGRNINIVTEKFENIFKKKIDTETDQLIRQMQDGMRAQGRPMGEDELTAQDREVFRNRAKLILRMRSQVLDIHSGLRFQFAKPVGFSLPEGEKLILKFTIENPQVNFTESKVYNIYYIYGPLEDPVRFGRVRPFTARNIHEVPMNPGRQTNVVEHLFGTNDTFCVSIFNVSHTGENVAMLKVPFLNDLDGTIDPSKVQVLYRESGFSMNLFRACGILFAWLGILAALGLFAASFMAFNVSAFACIGILFVATMGTDIMNSVLESGTIMNTYTLGERDSSIIDVFAIPAFTALVPVMESQKDYSPISNLAQGKSNTWGELVRAYSFIWGISGWLLGLLGVIIFSRRQLAITST